MFASFLRRRPSVDVAAGLREAGALRDQGRLREAESRLEAILEARPKEFEALKMLGDTRLGLGKASEAVPCYEAALSHGGSGDAQTLVNLGQALVAAGRAEEAVAVFDRALRLRSDVAQIYVARANALYGLQRHEEALTAYAEVLQRWPGHLDAGTNLGNALHAAGRSGEAVAQYDRVLAAMPTHVAAAYNRGTVLRALGRREEAVEALRGVLAVVPNHLSALHNLALILGELKRHAEAAECYRRLLAVEPRHPFAAGNLVHALAQNCDWTGRDALTAHIVDAVERGEHPCVPFVLMTLTDDAAAQLACAANHVASLHPARPNPLWTGERYEHDRIRVAYLSADFRDHAVAFLVAGLFEKHDRKHVEVTAISFGAGAKTPMRARIEAACDRFVDVGALSDGDAARRIRELEIDVAVDLMGHTGDARPDILAHRPAPIQVNYLGYPGTTGAPYIDYILADRFLIPERLKDRYSEQVVYLPDTFQVNDDRRAISTIPLSREDVGLPRDAFVFCCFSASYKIAPSVFDVWMRLLARVPGSVLWLVGGDATLERNLRREAASRGADAARLVFMRHRPYAEYLAHFRLADLFLDTLPFNAGTTASDALWAGLPVLTAAGEAFAARMAGSLLLAAGLPDFVADSLADYEDAALRLARDPARLAKARAQLSREPAKLPLFDTRRFACHVESAYRTMCERSRRGDAPGAFIVKPIRE
ncbi:MAG TPA: tetratricopeptide repeat protein [Casimicrobiaceae bacterium]|nr:tetratricopeptide repeat protein [Casimicrobiaceae bacterium]